MKSKESFIIYNSFYEPIADFTDGQLGILFRMLFKACGARGKGLDNIEPDDAVTLALGFFLNQIRVDNEKYQQRCEKNLANINKRWSAEKGTNVNECIRTYTKDTEKEKEKEKDKDKENENVNEKDSTKEKKSVSCKKVDLVLPYSSEEFISVWEVLKAQPNWVVKTQSALQLCLNSLKEYEEPFAIELMNTAIAHNYQGVVYPDTRNAYERWKQSRTPSRPVITSIDDLWKD